VPDAPPNPRSRGLQSPPLARGKRRVPASHPGLGPRHGAPQLSAERYFRFISPTHKRAEAHAPVRGSEFTIKVATNQGDSVEIVLPLNVKP